MTRAFVWLAIFQTLSSVGFAANFSIGKIIPELRLKDGSVLHSLTVVSVSSTGVMAKWEGGRGTIKFAQLPEDARGDFEKLVPSPNRNESAVWAEQQATRNAQWAKEDAEREALLKQPEPTRPPPPQGVTGNIGRSDGPPKVIRGQIFITTKGGVNYKLGAVTVYVYGNNEFVDLYAKVRAEIKPTLDYYTTMAKRASAKFQAPVARLYLNEGLAVIDSELTLLPQGPRTETDADGNFELRHTVREPFIIVARAKRQVGDDVEHYAWTIPSSKIEANGRLLLSNSNMQE